MKSTRTQVPSGAVLGNIYPDAPTMVLQFLGGAGEKIGVGLTMVRSGTYSSHLRSPTRRL